MNKRIRQYIGVLSALLVYYIVHEGAHFFYALTTGCFKGINFMALGIQIDIHREMLNDAQLGWFCLSGPLGTFLGAWVMIFLCKYICSLKSAVLKAMAWYTSITLLLLDPIYLSFLYRFVGGGDMNGIKLLLPENIAVGIFATIGILFFIILMKYLLPRYTQSFIA